MAAAQKVRELSSNVAKSGRIPALRSGRGGGDSQEGSGCVQADLERSAGSTARSGWSGSAITDNRQRRLRQSRPRLKPSNSSWGRWLIRLRKSICPGRAARAIAEAARGGGSARTGKRQRTAAVQDPGGRTWGRGKCAAGGTGREDYGDVGTGNDSVDGAGGAGAGRGRGHSQ